MGRAGAKLEKSRKVDLALAALALSTRCFGVFFHVIVPQTIVSTFLIPVLIVVVVILLLQICQSPALPTLARSWWLVPS